MRGEDDAREYRFDRVYCPHVCSVLEILHFARHSRAYNYSRGAFGSTGFSFARAPIGFTLRE